MAAYIDAYKASPYINKMAVNIKLAPCKVTPYKNGCLYVNP